MLLIIRLGTMNLLKKNWGMSSLIKHTNRCFFAISTIVFTFVPGFVFGLFNIFTVCNDLSIFINRILLLFFIYGVVYFILACRKSICIKGHNYKIKVEYGDIFQLQACKKIINFDECFTTEVGLEPYQIKPTSVCGQFLSKYPDLDIQKLLSSRGIKPMKNNSKYSNKKCYESGTILPYKNEYLLLAFAKLDEEGLAKMSRDDYLLCLFKLWKEIDKYSAQSDIAIPVLGAGITRFQGELLTQQQLVDIIIETYRLNPCKIKNPSTLHIVCREEDDFSLNKICEMSQLS